MCTCISVLLLLNIAYWTQDRWFMYDINAITLSLYVWKSDVKPGEGVVVVAFVVDTETEKVPMYVLCIGNITLCWTLNDVCHGNMWSMFFQFNVTLM